jgi:hypothetical protein
VSFDLFMNDTCRKCRKLIKLVSVTPMDVNNDLAVHKFECTHCGSVTKKIFIRKPNYSPPELVA